MIGEPEFSYIRTTAANQFIAIKTNQEDRIIILLNSKGEKISKEYYSIAEFTNPNYHQVWDFKKLTGLIDTDANELVKLKYKKPDFRG